MTLVAGTVGVFTQIAGAVHDTGAFEMEGNAVNDGAGVSGADDWDNVCFEATGNSLQCSTSNGTTGATAVDWTNDGALNASIFTGGGSKDPEPISKWAWKDDSGGLPDKDNLLHAFAVRYSLTPDATHCPTTFNDGTSTTVFPTCELLFFGSDRFDNSGDAHQAFWFLQDDVALGSNKVGGGTGFIGEHVAGDILVVSEFSNGGTTSTIKVWEWDPTCTKTGGTCADANLRILEEAENANCLLVSDGDAFCGIVNGSNGTIAPWPFTDKSGNNSYLQGEFFEAGINMSTLGLADRCFATVVAETRSSTSATATLKDFVLGTFGGCDSQIVTTPTDNSGNAIDEDPGISIGTGSVLVKDSATVTVDGTSTWEGTVEFYLCGPIPTGTCDTGGLKIGADKDVSDSSPTVSSDAATVTSAGRYCWRGVFQSETDNVPDATDSSTGECFVVTPVQTALDTAAVTSPVNFGQPVQDNATLSNTATQPGTNGPNATYPSINATNGPAAGGKITFTLLKNDCSTLATGTGTNPQDFTPISGDGTYGPVSFTPDAPGTYHWKAQYIPATGDPNNVGVTHNSACNDSDETVVVSTIPTSIDTRQWIYPNDKARISASAGSESLDGTVTFKLYDTAENCAADGTLGLLYSENVSVSGASPQFAETSNTTFRVAADDVVYWRVIFDSNKSVHDDSVSACTENTDVDFTGNDNTITFS